MQAPISVKNKMVSNYLLPKTSTPIRARVILKDAPINSTPINHLKLCVSPNGNKENLDCSNNSYRDLNKAGEVNNIRKNRQEGKASNLISFADFRFSKKDCQIMGTGIQMNDQMKLSPILSLSKNPNKLQQSASFSANNFRSFTPNNMPKTYHPTINTSKQKLSNPVEADSIKNHLSVTSQYQTLNQSSSSSNLRSSKSFSNLFQPRSKTPTRLGSMAFGSLSRKNDSSPGGENGNLFGKNSKRYRGETDVSGEEISLQIDSFSNSFAEGVRMMCMNNHGKAAKYRIKSSEEEDIAEAEEFVYCSKCAIDMVQKGFSVEELQVASVVTGSNYNQRQSNSNKMNFMSFKPTANQQMIQKLKRAENLKNSINQKITEKTQRRQMIESKIKQQMKSIDCYYDSIVCYVEQQRARDRHLLEDVGKKVWEGLEGKHEEGMWDEHVLNRYHEALDLTLRNRVIDSAAVTIINEVERHLQLINSRTHNAKYQFQQLMSNPQTPLLTYPSSIQQQFDQFVSYFDTKGKILYKTFQQSRTISKNHALRFSFQKALQTQHRQNSFISDNQIMNPLQEQSEDECDDNSFSHENMKKTTDSCENLQQKPFRTLFAEEDNILETDEQDDAVKNDMYSPTFKSI